MQRHHLDVLLRTYLGQNVHHGKRFAPFRKAELIIGCLHSLIATIKDAERIADIKLTIFDDHSQKEFLSKIEGILRDSGVTWQLINRSDTGNPESFTAVYNFAREYARDLIYFVEDDYLHSTHALKEMLTEYDRFSEKLPGANIGFVPYEHPDIYLYDVISPSRVVLGLNRHWRTVDYSNSTMLIPKKLLMDEWYKFQGMTLYGVFSEVFEATTINKIWREGNNFLFSPIPTLAIHMQFSENIPPLTNWEEWWNNYSYASAR